MEEEKALLWWLFRPAIFAGFFIFSLIFAERGRWLRFVLQIKINWFQGGVKISTGGKAAKAGKPASGRSAADFGLIPEPTVQSG